MPRAKRGSKGRRRHNKVLKAAKGNVGARRRLYRPAASTVDRALAYAYRDRRQKKRDFRSLWIVRINAAVRPYGFTYSRFMAGLKSAGIEMDRKQLSELAIHDPAAFAALVEAANGALAEA